MVQEAWLNDPEVHHLRFLVQEVTWLMVQEVTLVEALLGMERSWERS